MLFRNCPCILVFLLLSHTLIAQGQSVPHDTEQALVTLIDSYSSARETQDTLLLKEILTSDIDQLVSSGEWRIGLATAVNGMRRSSQVNEGKRTLAVERIKLLNATAALIDARYTITPTDGSAIRNMWSTFIAVFEDGKWKISGIRNMLPSVE
nr:DUF4440 domain-containing protein [Cytophagales bacterium]